MPHLRFRALESSQVASLSLSLMKPLALLIPCPPDDITFESIASQFFYEGQPSVAYPFVEILWFDRGQEIQDKVAQLVTDAIRQLLDDPNKDVAIIFTLLKAEQYYDNGSHYG